VRAVDTDIALSACFHDQTIDKILLANRVKVKIPAFEAFFASENSRIIIFQAVRVSGLTKTERRESEISSAV
jgi:hypothetical protein